MAKKKKKAAKNKKKAKPKKTAKTAKVIAGTAKPKRAKKPASVTFHGLHEKKLAIMEEHPIMQCSILTSDRAGNVFAHTKASETCGKYSKACRDRRLVIRMIECEMETVDFGSHKGSRAKCKFEIKDVDTGEAETFCGSGLGDNMVWSDNSAQTVAFKQALLMYFFAAWPQPEEFISVAKDYMEKLPTDRFVDAIKEITPPAVKTDADAISDLKKFWDEMSF